MIKVTDKPIDVAAELAALENNDQVGAAVTFSGYVRNDTLDGTAALETLTLEHWPGATEKALANIAAKAETRFDISGTVIVHRYGPMKVGEMIVLVAAQSRHRDAAFEAARFMMDYLKTDAPFWKKVARTDGTEEWVEAATRDDTARARWDEG
ncbi:MAG: molybdenum cofactor biosynthesis protein MoaE [Alphaproteobacteria bacterium]